MCLSFSASLLMTKNEMQIMDAAMTYNTVIFSPLKMISPIIANGIVVDKPTVTINGDVSNIALTQQKSEMNVIKQLIKIILITKVPLGNSNFSTPV